MLAFRHPLQLTKSQKNELASTQTAAKFLCIDTAFSTVGMTTGLALIEIIVLHLPLHLWSVSKAINLG